MGSLLWKYGGISDCKMSKMYQKWIFNPFLGDFISSLIVMSFVTGSGHKRYEVPKKELYAKHEGVFGIEYRLWPDPVTNGILPPLNFFVWRGFPPIRYIFGASCCLWFSDFSFVSFLSRYGVVSCTKFLLTEKFSY